MAISGDFRSSGLELKVIANPVVAGDLEVIFSRTPPRYRLVVAAARLGIPTWQIFVAAGYTQSSYYHYTIQATRARYKDRSLPGRLMVNLAKALGVSFESLWDAEALDKTEVVVDVPVSVAALSKASESEERRKRRTRPARLAQALARKAG